MSLPPEFVQRVKDVAKNNQLLHQALDAGDLEQVERILMKASYGALRLYFEETVKGSRPYPPTIQKVQITKDLYEEFLKHRG